MRVQSGDERVVLSSASTQFYYQTIYHLHVFLFVSQHPLYLFVMSVCLRRQIRAHLTCHLMCEKYPLSILLSQWIN